MPSGAAREATTRVLVAGIGNIFLGDDGFGVEVANRMAREPLGDGVEVVDFGIRGIHLAYELSGGRYDAAILVDAVSRGEPPGTLYAIEPELSLDAVPEQATDAHRATPDVVLAMLRRIGGPVGRLVIVGCEPATTEESMGLSAPVAASIDAAIQMIRRLVSEMTGAAPCV